MTEVNQYTITEDIYKEFYKLIKGNVTDPNGRARFIYSAFPDKEIGSPSIYSTDYPLIIINSPELGEEDLTLKKGAYTFNIEVEYFGNSAKSTDEKTSEIIKAIKIGKASLADTGLQRIKLVSKNVSTVIQGEVKVHIASIVFSGYFYFEKDVGY